MRLPIEALSPQSDNHTEVKATTEGSYSRYSGRKLFAEAAKMVAHLFPDRAERVQNAKAEYKAWLEKSAAAVAADG